MNERSLLFLETGCLLLFLLLSPGLSWGESSAAVTTSCTSCCNPRRPYPGISAEDLMRIKYDIKYTRFARDYRGYGFFKLCPSGGPVRSRYWRRYRIILGGKNTEVDYKDLIILMGPQIVKGLSVLTWTYTDPRRDNEVWAWIPSLRKVRRMSQAEEADDFWGTDFTTEDVSTRRWEDETFTAAGEERFSGYFSSFSGKVYYRDTDCYLVEGRPKKRDWYYSRRLMHLHKETGGLIFDEMYSPDGTREKNFLKVYHLMENGCIPQIFIQVESLKEQHKTVVGFDSEDIIFNTGIQESFFSEKTLMRSKW